MNTQIHMDTITTECVNGICSSSHTIDQTMQYVCQAASSSSLSSTAVEAEHRQEQTVEQTLPQSFFCPLTMNVMVEPVIDYEGNTYERNAILTWLKDHDTSPVTRNPLTINNLIPNRAIRDAICDKMGQEWTKNAERIMMEQRPLPALRSEKGPSATLTNRSKMNSFLRELGATAGKCLSLDSHGVCAFACERLTIALEVPESVGSFILYTSIGEIAAASGEPETDQHRDIVYRRILELNYLQQKTKGGCLSVDPTSSRIVFSYIDRVGEINDLEFHNIVENFIDTALNLKQWIQPLLCGTDIRLSSCSA